MRGHDVKNFVFELTAFGLFFIAIACLFGISLSVSAIIGITSGMLFALLLSIVNHRLQSELIRSALKGYLHTEPANYLFKNEAIGGCIFLYNDRLEFHAHALNVNKDNLLIPYHEIKEIENARFSRKVNVLISSGKNIVFIVNSGSRFAKNLSKYIKKANLFSTYKQLY